MHRLLIALADRRARRRQRRMLNVALGALHDPCGNRTCSCYGIRQYAAARLEALR